MSQNAKDDFSWRRANRNYAPHGLILPSLYSQRCGPVAIWIDTSGSCWQDTILSKFLAWTQAILDDFRPSELRVYQGDAKVQDYTLYEPGDDVKLDVKGGGGTDVAPVIKAVLTEDEPPELFIGLTDLYAEFGPEPPIPVAWVTPTDKTAPFGQVIKMY
jgi:predicted metal-dependent peptidase